MNVALHLEHILRTWEDMWFWLTSGYPFNGIERVSPVENWRDFRKFLLNRRDDDTSFNQMWPFSRPMSGLTPLHNALGSITPFVLSAWCCWSRRVFNLSSDLQLLLQATSLRRVKLADVKMPFKCMVIQLSEPLMYAGAPLDLLVMTRLFRVFEGREQVEIFLLNRNILEYEHLSLVDKKKVKKNLGISGRFSKVTSFLDVYQKRTLMKSIGPECVKLSILPQFFGLPLLESIRKSREVHGTEDQNEEFVALADTALQIAVGLCLYLHTFPSGNSYIRDNIPLRAMSSSGGIRGEGVTDGAKVCDVSTEYALSTEEREIYLRIPSVGVDRFITPHFRMGHWRRPPGKGNDPDVEKTIWIRPALVNAHLLNEGEIPKGAVTHV